MEQSQSHVESVLTEDTIKVPGQRWALISVVGKDTNQKHVDGICALKIRGVFEMEEDAKDHAKSLMQVDPNFDIYIVDMYRWLAIPPNRSEVAEKCGQEYQEKQLNDIIQDYTQQQRRVKMAYEERKQAMLEQAHKDNEKRRLENGESSTLPSDKMMDNSDTTPTDIMNHLQ